MAVLRVSPCSDISLLGIKEERKEEGKEEGRKGVRKGRERKGRKA